MHDQSQSWLLPRDEHKFNQAVPKSTWAVRLQLAALRSIEVLQETVLEGVRRALTRDGDTQVRSSDLRGQGNPGVRRWIPGP